MIKKILFFLLILCSMVGATTYKICFFDNEDLELFQSYVTNNQIPVTNQTIYDDRRISISGPFNPYDTTRIWSAVEVIRRGLPITYKTPTLIYMEIFISLGGNMGHVNDALGQIPIFDMYLENYDYVGASECIKSAYKFLTLYERNAIISVLPQP